MKVIPAIISAALRLLFKENVQDTFTELQNEDLDIGLDNIDD